MGLGPRRWKQQAGGSGAAGPLLSEQGGGGGAVNGTTSEELQLVAREAENATVKRDLARRRETCQIQGGTTGSGQQLDLALDAEEGRRGIGLTRTSA